MIRTQFISKKILTQISIVKIKKKEDFDEEEILQAIIDEETKEKLKKRR
jgi:hypothetical protein